MTDIPQIEAAEVAIWVTEVAPTDREGKRFLEHLKNANHDAK
jgi:type III restriction enzyme